MYRPPACFPLAQYKRMQVLVVNCARRWKSCYRFAKPDAPNRDYLQNQNQELGELNELLTRRSGFVEKEYLRNHNKATDPETYYEQRGWRVFYVGDDLKSIGKPQVNLTPQVNVKPQVDLTPKVKWTSANPNEAEESSE